MSMPAEECEEFNAHFPIGTLVRFWPVDGLPGFRDRVTRSEAYVLSGHTAVIFLEGESGCVALSHCRPVDLCA